MDFIEALEWRYATKKMTGKKVPVEKLNKILEAIRLAPTSIGLQPFNVIVVESRELKEKMLPVVNNQRQTIDSSQMIVFAIWDKITEEKADEYIKLMASVREVPEESLSGLRSYLKSVINSNSEEDNLKWAAKQAYIALGTGLSAAAMEGVDATPMEGFNAAALDELLGLKEKGLKSVVLMAIGYRDVENDTYSKAKKVRRPRERFFIHK